MKIGTDQGSGFVQGIIYTLIPLIISSLLSIEKHKESRGRLRAFLSLGFGSFGFGYMLADVRDNIEILLLLIIKIKSGSG
jgi:hypothetical protein